MSSRTVLTRGIDDSRMESPLLLSQVRKYIFKIVNNVSEVQKEFCDFMFPKKKKVNETHPLKNLKEYFYKAAPNTTEHPFWLSNNHHR